MVSRADYAGREQSYVKHVILEQYLARLVHKTASAYRHIVYVDGFAGPWQSANEKLEDTSFGIALKALRAAKESWKNKGRDVWMSAHLVEQNAAAYKQLAAVPARYPDIAIKTYSADFLTVLPTILKAIPRDAFAFFLVDPKGWRIPLQAVAAMLERPKSELIFTFMFDFINRAAGIRDPAVVAGLAELIPYGNWRQQLEAAEKRAGDKLSADERKAILVGAFGESLARLGSYPYVVETTVSRPQSDRPLYCLCYATRHEMGLEVFRDSQVKALEAEADTRAQVKLSHAATKSGQTELFGSLREMAREKLPDRLEQERGKAEQILLAVTPRSPQSIPYQQLWPQVLAQCIIRHTEVNALVAKLREDKALEIPDWEKGKRVPQPHYRIRRP